MSTTMKYYILFFCKDIQLGWWKFKKARAESKLAMMKDKIRRIV